MTEENNPNQTPEPEEPIHGEFKRLGDNIRSAFNTAWESEDRKRVQKDIEKGLTELGSALGEVVDDLSKHPASQQVISDIDEFSEKVRTGEMETKVRTEMLSALRLVNEEIEKLSKHRQSSSTAAEEEETPTPED